MEISRIRGMVFYVVEPFQGLWREKLGTVVLQLLIIGVPLELSKR